MGCLECARIRAPTSCRLVSQQRRKEVPMRSYNRANSRRSLPGLVAIAFCLCTPTAVVSGAAARVEGRTAEEWMRLLTNLRLQELAVDALGQLGEHAVDPLLAALRGPMPEDPRAGTIWRGVLEGRCPRPFVETGATRRGREYEQAKRAFSCSFAFSITVGRSGPRGAELRGLYSKAHAPSG